MNSSLILIFDYVPTEVDLNAMRLPVYIARFNKEPLEVEEHIDEAIEIIQEASGIKKIPFMYVMEDTEESVAVIEQKFKAVSQKSKKKVSPNIVSIDIYDEDDEEYVDLLPDSIKSTHDDVEAEEGEDTEVGLLLAVYGPPIFKPQYEFMVNVEKEPPVDVMPIENLDSYTLMEVLTQIEAHGITPSYWEVYPATEGNIRKFEKDRQELLMDLASCKACQRENKKKKRNCSTCKYQHMNEVVANAIKNKIKFEEVFKPYFE